MCIPGGTCAARTGRDTGRGDQAWGCLSPSRGHRGSRPTAYAAGVTRDTSHSSGAVRAVLVAEGPGPRPFPTPHKVISGGDFGGHAFCVHHVSCEGRYYVIVQSVQPELWFSGLLTSQAWGLAGPWVTRGLGDPGAWGEAKDMCLSQGLLVPLALEPLGGR